MQPFCRIIYRLSLFLINFWILITIIWLFLPLEFSNNNSEYIFSSIYFFILPIAIILTLAGTLKSSDSIASILGTIVLTLILSITVVFVMRAASFSGMCAWAIENFLFENKQSSSIKIVERSYGCGALDSGDPIFKVVQITEITQHFIWISDVDTSSINKNDWWPIENVDSK